MDREPVLSRATGLAVLAMAATVYVGMLPLFAESGRPRMWPTWWVLLPVTVVVVATVLMLLPLRRRAAPPARPMPMTLPPPSIEIGGGPGVKVSRVTIENSYSNSPHGLASIGGDIIEDITLEGNIHDVPDRPTDPDETR